MTAHRRQRAAVAMPRPRAADMGVAAAPLADAHERYQRHITQVRAKIATEAAPEAGISTKHPILKILAFFRDFVISITD